MPTRPRDTIDLVLYGLSPLFCLIRSSHSSVAHEDGENKVLAIERWNTDSIEEFLNTHLDSADASEDYLRTNQV
ncbi:hypothetical protein J6590_064139 [Homalodisca vitripennis]|nr:hypothetical protein J6590_064139 [Homalodisca vitripennis]